MLKPLNTKINETYYKLLVGMHKKSAVPMSKIIERSLEMFARHLKDMDAAMTLLRDVEDARRDYEKGDVHGIGALDDILKKIESRAR